MDAHGGGGEGVLPLQQHPEVAPGQGWGKGGEGSLGGSREERERSHEEGGHQLHPGVGSQVDKGRVSAVRSWRATQGPIDSREKQKWGEGTREGIGEHTGVLTCVCCVPQGTFEGAQPVRLQLGNSGPCSSPVAL